MFASIVPLFQAYFPSDNEGEGVYITEHLTFGVCDVEYLFIPSVPVK